MASKNSDSLALPDTIFQALLSADNRLGFPPGTMASVMQQEVGGQTGKYLSDPAAYHYGLDSNGQRVAANGKVSTAFGPFGILESTAANPGFGVAPLKGKSFDEQLRFAGDYLAARAKAAGGLQQGLAGYGEGGRYARQVMARAGGYSVPSAPGSPEPVATPVMEEPVTAIGTADIVPQAPMVATAQPMAQQPANAAQPSWFALSQNVPPSQMTGDQFQQAMARFGKAPEVALTKSKQPGSGWNWVS